MAAGLAHISLIGNVGKAPETRQFDSGSSSTTFTLAVAGRKKDAESTWYSIRVFGKLAEIVQQYVVKGMKVFVSGDLEMRTYVDKNGNNRISYDVTADHINFLTPKGDSRPVSAEEDLPF